MTTEAPSVIPSERSESRDLHPRSLPRHTPARKTAHPLHSQISITFRSPQPVRRAPGASITYMSSVRTPLAGVVSFLVLAACAADAPKSSVSGGEVAAAPAPAESN